MANKTKQKPHKRSRNETDKETDTDSENEKFIRSNNWPRFLIMKGPDENLPLSKRPPIAVQTGFQAIARDPEKHQKAARWLLSCQMSEKNPC